MNIFLAIVKNVLMVFQLNSDINTNVPYHWLGLYFDNNFINISIENLQSDPRIEPWTSSSLDWCANQYVIQIQISGQSALQEVDFKQFRYLNLDGAREIKIPGSIPGSDYDCYLKIFNWFMFFLLKSFKI